MKAGHIKGALLEFIIRKLLRNCGFKNVRADNVYTFENQGLFYIHGKGAAHDADIIMTPPIQMPFSYPTKLVFECKAYKSTTALTIVRNALGLREDLNAFEIVTLDSLRLRQNNRRTTYALETRNRSLFQVGVASIGAFSRNAIEFAANNKIPLLSLTWFLGSGIEALFEDIDQSYIDTIDGDILSDLYRYFKDREAEQLNYQLADSFLTVRNRISEIVNLANQAITYSFIGLLETGDMVFLYAEEPESILSARNRLVGLKAEIHWTADQPNIWRLTVYSQSSDLRSNYRFYVPDKILNHWSRFSYNQIEALNIKEQYFSRIFVFHSRYNQEVPFSIINIDEYWLSQARFRLEEEGL